MKCNTDFRSISDDELLRRLSELLQRSRCAEAELVAHIAEVDARRLYARQAASSMFVYCTQTLHLSEGEALFAYRTARVSRKHPVLLEMLSDGSLHLSGIDLLAPDLPASRTLIDSTFQGTLGRTRKEDDLGNGS